MLVERGIRVTSVSVVGDAYAIAANYLRRAGAIPDDFVTNDLLVEIIVGIMHTYDLLMNRSAAASAEARVKVTDYLKTLFEAGETDINRLTVCGLTYLRELDGSNDPVKAGYTGL